MPNNSNDYYLTEVDKCPESIYCMHDLMGEQGISYHQHNKGQFLYTEGGLVHVLTDEKTFFLPARHYMWIAPGIAHSIHPGSADVIMRNLYFPVEADENSFFSNTAIYPVNELLLQMIIYSNRWTGDISPDQLNSFRFALALKSVLPDISKYNLPLALPYPQDRRLGLVIQFMELSLDDTIVFPELAKRFGFSERSLSRLFQNDVGMSFIQYYTLQRMMRALKLLLEDKLSVKEVAARVGYNSIPTFSTTFYKILGIRPSDYVKKKGVLS
ncbi:helix-turn-helix transcriptional regulator [Pedobacter nyackensis]|uniref:AraC family transcriptional regulator n=1 Tax=Pedobacter nyackensis TaxID=475255 RepID=UPI00292EEE94|nr:helix-turn-helix transcriptional regulator [Pedobacter nyackensis]